MVLSFLQPLCQVSVLCAVHFHGVATLVVFRLHLANQVHTSFLIFLELGVFIVVLILQSQNVLVEGDFVGQESFVATSSVLHLNFTLLVRLDLELKDGGLALQVLDEVFLRHLALFRLVFVPGFSSELLRFALQIGVTLVLLVSVGTDRPWVLSVAGSLS